MAAVVRTRRRTRAQRRLKKRKRKRKCWAGSALRWRATFPRPFAESGALAHDNFEGPELDLSWGGQGSDDDDARAGGETDDEGENEDEDEDEGKNKNKNKNKNNDKEQYKDKKQDNGGVGATRWLFVHYVGRSRKVRRWWQWTWPRGARKRS